MGQLQVGRHRENQLEFRIRCHPVADQLRPLIRPEVMRQTRIVLEFAFANRRRTELVRALRHLFDKRLLDIAGPTDFVDRGNHLLF